MFKIFDKTFEIYVKNAEVTISAKKGATLYNVLVENKLMTEKMCNGNGGCGKCRVFLLGDNIRAATNIETTLIGKLDVDKGCRLACQTKIKENLIVSIPEASSVMSSTKADLGKLDTIDMEAIVAKGGEPLPQQADEHDAHSDKSKEDSKSKKASASAKAKKSKTKTKEDEIQDKDEQNSAESQDTTLTDANRNGQVIDLAEIFESRLNAKNAGTDEVYFHAEEDANANSTEKDGEQVQQVHNYANIHDVTLLYYHNGRVQYFHYEANINQITGEGFVNDEAADFIETLKHGSLKNFVMDYTNNYKVPERIIVVSDTHTYVEGVINGKVLFNLASHRSFSRDNIIVELVQPTNESNNFDNVTKLIKLINVPQKILVKTISEDKMTPPTSEEIPAKSIILMPDMLDKIYFKDGTSIFEFSTEGIFTTKSMFLEINNGRNAILETNSEFKIARTQAELLEPDSITVLAMLKLIHSLKEGELLNDNNLFLDKQTLAFNFDLTTATKFSYKGEGRNLYKIFNSKSQDLSLSENYIHDMLNLGTVIDGIYKVVKRNISEINNLCVVLPFDIPFFDEALRSINAFPEELVNSVNYIYRPATTASLKLLNTNKGIDNYIANMITSIETIKLRDIKAFQKLMI